jgi:hypothetical protein
VVYVSTQWTKFPSFVAYANEQGHFVILTPDAVEWAHKLAIPTVKRGGGRLWSPEEAWEQLRAHQPWFQAFLNALIAGQPTREHMEVLATHCNHIVCRSSWDRTPEAERIAAAQRYNDRARYEAFRQRRLAQGRTLFEPPPQRTPLPRYFEVMTPQDPLDGLYWELREFLRRGQPERLHQCPACGRYFVQATARAQTYCGTTCRLKANPTRREKNPEYVKRHREGKVREELQRVREAKKTLGSYTLADILKATGISKRRWNTLQKWEVEQYRRPRVTDLTT